MEREREGGEMAHSYLSEEVITKLIVRTSS